MRKRRIGRGAVTGLTGVLLLSGCYYDPATGYTYAAPPPPAGGYGGPPPADYGAPPGGGGYGGPPAADYGAPPGGGYGAPPGGGYGTPPGGGYGAPPGGGYGAPPGGGYGAPPGGGYGAAPAAGAGITRQQYVDRAMQRAQSRNGNPQAAAQRAAAVFDQIDVNHTGIVTRAQIRAWREAHRGAPGQAPPPEY